MFPLSLPFSSLFLIDMSGMANLMADRYPTARNSSTSFLGHNSGPATTRLTSLLSVTQ